MLAPQQQPDFAAMRAEIEAAREVPELVHIIGQAKASRAYYKQAKDAENSWQSFQFQLRAERKAGQLLIEMNEAGVRTKGRAVPGFKVGSPTGQPTLAHLGVSRMESQTLQQLAKVPAPAFEAALADPAAARIMRANAVTPGGQKAREGLGEAKIRNIALSSISISSRLRALRPDKVDEFAESMRDRRLINPITVRRLDDGGHRLIAGHHRLEAARKLGWEGIPAIIFKGIDAVDAELLEIDENLLNQHPDCRDRRDEKCIPVIGKDRHGADGQHQQDAESARHAAARVQDQADGCRIHSGVDQRDESQARPLEPAGNDEQHCRREIGDARG